MPPSLILIGASVRAAAFSAVRAGYQPYSIDLFADRDLAAVGPAIKIARYPDDFLPALAAAPAAPWIYTGGLENYPRLVDRLAALRPLLGNRGDALRGVRDPVALRTAAGDAGCRFPETVVDGTAGVPLAGKTESVKQPWLVKPRHSSGGVSIRFATECDLARRHRGTYLQQYVAGEAASAVFVAGARRAMLLGVTRQLVGSDFGMPRQFLYVGSLGPLLLEEAELSCLLSLGNLLAERFGLVGLFNIDFVRNRDGIWPLEVNPRYSASIEVIERLRGISAIDLHARACQSGGLPELEVADTVRSASKGSAGKAVVYAQRDGVVPAEFDVLVSRWNGDGQRPFLADLPRVGEPLRKDQPILTVIAEDDSLADVEADLRRRIAEIHDVIAGS